MEAIFLDLLRALSLPQYGLPTVFLASFLAGTIVPLTPSPFVIGMIKLNPNLFWQTIFVASIGNTLGGSLNWWIGYGAQNIHEKITHKKTHGRVMNWLEKLGPKACLLAWFPGIGDPLTIAAGWLRLPLWPCMGYMFTGRILRFLVIAALVRWFWPGALLV